MKRMILLLCLVPLIAFAAGDSYKLQKAPINYQDNASLQRGAKYFMNYCAGCHTLKYVRYNRMAKDIGIVGPDGTVDEKLLKDHLIFADDKVADTIRIAIPAYDAELWFGVTPPDLSLIARVRGVDWLYTYLRSYYQDPKRPLGVNNALVPDVAMPNVLEGLQGVQEPVYHTQTVMYEGQAQKTQVIDHLKLVKQGTMTPAQYDAMVGDIVNFLAYVGEPVKRDRQRIGVWVLSFLGLLLIILFLLKREFWRDIHKD